jgi:hypothetical protein
MGFAHACSSALPFTSRACVVPCMVLLLALPRGVRFDFAKQGAAGDASVRSGASTTQTYDITVSPGTPATTVQLYYTLEEMISLFDPTTPVRTVNLVYTCT